MRTNLTLQQIEGLLPQYGLNISEIFFSIEGEGIRIGEPTIYIRVIGCPHNCSWCDSKYSGGSNKLPTEHFLSLKKITERVDALVELNLLHSVNIELTGGSPDWFPDEVGLLMEFFKKKYSDRCFLTLQISGGIAFVEGCKLFDHSDLLRISDLNAVDYKDFRENIPFVLEELLRTKDEIKFLIKDEESYSFVKSVLKSLRKKGIHSKAIITTVTNNQNVGIVEDHLAKLEFWTKRILSDEMFSKENIKILPRMHILLWGNKRGV